MRFRNFKRSSRQRRRGCQRRSTGWNIRLPLKLEKIPYRNGLQRDSATAAAEGRDVSLDIEETKVQENENYMLQCKRPDKV